MESTRTRTADSAPLVAKRTRFTKFRLATAGVLIALLPRWAELRSGGCGTRASCRTWEIRLTWRGAATGCDCGSGQCVCGVCEGDESTE